MPNDQWREQMAKGVVSVSYYYLVDQKIYRKTYTKTATIVDETTCCQRKPRTSILVFCEVTAFQNYPHVRHEEWVSSSKQYFIWLFSPMLYKMKSYDINLYIIFKTEITNYSEWKNTL